MIWRPTLILVLSIAGAGCVQTRLTEVPRDAVIVDVRTRTEYSLGRLACAGNLPHYEAADADAADRVLPDKTRPVIVYCMSGHRSATAKKRLEALGYEDVRDGGAYESLRRLVIKTNPSSACRRFR